MQNPTFEFDVANLTYSEPLDAQAMLQEDADVDITGLQVTGADEELLTAHFEKEEPLLAKHVASGIVSIQFVELFKKMGVDDRRSLANTILQLSETDGSKISTSRVESFANASEETRERAIHLTTFRPVYFHTFAGFHLWMKRQPDVAFAWVANQPDNNNEATTGEGRIVYRRGAVNLELDPTVPIHALGRAVEDINKLLLSAFGDKAFKPQLRVVEERVIRVAAQMLLVGTMKMSASTNQYRYEAYTEPIMYRPHWKSAEVPMPSPSVGYLKGLWTKYFKHINKSLRQECVLNLEYVINKLVASRVETKIRDVVNVSFTPELKAQFDTELDRAKSILPDRQKIAREIEESNAALTKSRGFRGAKADLDALTHNMFEVHQIGAMAMDEDVAHARLIGSLHTDMVRSGLKSLTVYDYNFSGKMSVMYKALVRESVPYSTILRADVLGEAKPIRLEKSSGAINDVDLHHLSVEIPIRTQALAWFVQFEASKSDKSYIETHRASFEKLRDAVKKHNPHVVYVPIQLSFLNADHPLAEIVGRAKSISPLVSWSRAHNAEIWFRIEMDTETAPGEGSLLRFNVLQVLVGRRLRLCNYFRDFLMSGGYVEENLGVIVDSDTLNSICRVYCLSKVVVESTKVVASTWKGVTPSEKPVDLDIDVNNLFPELGTVRSVAKPRESHFERHKTKRDERSPSVSSTESVDSRASTHEVRRHWGSDDEEEEEPLADRREEFRKPEPAPVKKTVRPTKVTSEPRKSSRAPAKKTKK